MPFNKEPKEYTKTILSDLQGAWSLLRESVVNAAGFEGWERAIFHIDEAMSWEVVRDLRKMPPLLLIIKNICLFGEAPQDVTDSIRNVDDVLHEVLAEMHH